MTGPSTNVDETYQICSECVMDTSDSLIRFDQNGVCDHCREYRRRTSQKQLTQEEKTVRLEAVLEEIRESGQGKDYDSVLGLSGGVDSSFVAHLAKEYGLRPLVIHIDCGWDSELAVRNIEDLVKKLDYDLYTHVIDWEEYRDLQVAYLKASVVDSEVPFDHSIPAVLYRETAKLGLKHILAGMNQATETVMPLTWSYRADDLRNLKAINRKFGTRRLRTYPTFSLANRLWYEYVRRIETIPLLDYISYDKAAAIAVLEDKYGWRYYGGKHYESIYTRFFQGYILPEKFGVDKRRAHLSNLVLSGQMSREEALEELRTKDPYNNNAELLQDDLEYVPKKLSLTQGEFDEIMKQEPRSHLELANIYTTMLKIRNLQHRFGRGFGESEVQNIA